MASQYGYQAASVITAPAQDAFAITPSDVSSFAAQSLPPVCRAIFCGTGGNINLVTAGGTTVLFNNVSSGFILPVACQQIKATSTTATNLVGLV